MNLKNRSIIQRCHEWEFTGMLQCMIKEFRRMPFIWEYQRPLTKKRQRVPITLGRKSWVHWNIIQECWHTGNSQILLPWLLEAGPIWILSKSYSFKTVIHSLSSFVTICYNCPLFLLILSYTSSTHYISTYMRARTPTHTQIYRFRSQIHILCYFSSVANNSMYHKIASISHFKNYKIKSNWIIFPSCHRSLVLMKADGDFQNLVSKVTWCLLLSSMFLPQIDTIR